VEGRTHRRAISRQSLFAMRTGRSDGGHRNKAAMFKNAYVHRLVPGLVESWG